MRYRTSFPVAEVTLPPPGRALPSVFAFSMHKAGSTLLNLMLREAAVACGVAYVAVEDQLFGKGLIGHTRPKSLAVGFPPVGYCFGGFRRYPTYALPPLDEHRSVFLVRDPRDMLVSLYFSVAYSHTPPGGGPDSEAVQRFHQRRARVQKITPDEFALRNVTQYARTIEGYYAHGFLRREAITVYRYEDVIFRKRAWLADMCQLFGWPCDEAAIAAIAEQHDERPDEERPDQHVRVVTPGNYRKHLSPGVVRRINATLEEYLADLGYEMDEAPTPPRRSA